MTDHRRLIGLPGQLHTGVESRALRASLNLERRHVVALANAIGLYDDEVTTSQVTSWERGKPGGYPEALTTAMEAIEFAVAVLGNNLSVQAVTQAPKDGSRTAVLRRPLGGKRILTVLRLGDCGLVLAPSALAVLDQGGGDFWQALADAAVNRALLQLNLDGSLQAARVVLDRETV